MTFWTSLSVGKTSLKPSPCPCCGNVDLYVGVTASCQMGVECNRAQGGCGLSIHRRYPEKMPRGIKTLKELDRMLLLGAIKAWNRRTYSEKKVT